MPDLSLCSGESSVLFIVNLYFLQYIFKNCLSNGKGLLGGNKLKNPVLKYGLNYCVIRHVFPHQNSLLVVVTPAELGQIRQSRHLKYATRRR